VSPNPYTTLDNLTVGTAAPVGSVPEPGRLALMGLGVAALWFMRRAATPRRLRDAPDPADKPLTRP
jgi:hypothetical protein